MTYEAQCVAAIQSHDGVRRCGRRSQPSADPMFITLIPVCSHHLTKARSQFAGPIEKDLAKLKRERELHDCDGERAIRKHIEEVTDQHLQRNARHKASALAYFIQCGRYIKIGASASPLQRLETIRTTGGVLAPPGLNLSRCKLLATEPGGFDRERELHEQFQHLRHTGEWFIAKEELTNYIDQIEKEKAVTMPGDPLQQNPYQGELQ